MTKQNRTEHSLTTYCIIHNKKPPTSLGQDNLPGIWKAGRHKTGTCNKTESASQKETFELIQMQLQSLNTSQESSQYKQKPEEKPESLKELERWNPLLFLVDPEACPEFLLHGAGFPRPLWVVGPEAPAPLLPLAGRDTADELLPRLDCDVFTLPTEPPLHPTKQDQNKAVLYGSYSRVLLCDI